MEKATNVRTSVINQYPLQMLYIADPEVGNTVDTLLKQKQIKISEDILQLLVEDVICSLSQETDFGYSVARGYCKLIGEVDVDRILKYHSIITKSVPQGPTLGKLLSDHTPLVLAVCSDEFFEEYIKTVDIMLSKGAYTLYRPLETVSELLNSKDIPSATSFIKLLSVIYSKEMSYNQCLHLTYSIPSAILSLPPRKRQWQIDQLCKVLKIDINLSESFLNGLQNDLKFLSQKGLEQFVSIGLSFHPNDFSKTAKFFSLASSQAKDICAALSISEHFDCIQKKFNQYLVARTGISLTIHPFSIGESTANPNDGMVFSDGIRVYVPEEISLFETRDLNRLLYQTLIKLESAYYEFGTYDFDLEKALNKELPETIPYVSDLEHFFMMFPNQELASDLFTIFEHGRIRRLIGKLYPGMLSSILPVLVQEANHLYHEEFNTSILHILYERISLGQLIKIDKNMPKELIEDIVYGFEKKIDETAPVEASATLVIQFYPIIEKWMNLSNSIKNIYMALKTPFGIKPRPAKVFATWSREDQLANALKQKLKKYQIHLYKSDIRKYLLRQDGYVNQQNLQQMIIELSKDPSSINRLSEIAWQDVFNTFGKSIVTNIEADNIERNIFWYKEWDATLGDYLHRHVRIREREIEGSNCNFYAETLQKYSGLVRRIRHAFELLKPEGLILLRRWIEGDEFDYRALLNYAVEKRAGVTPSERLYMKRVKHHRDVSVLLLVDISKSTANPVFGTNMSVLQVEKEAIVLFCEALSVIGDSFSIAGFSGTGRLGVDYYKIKDFDEPMNKTVQARIQSLTPQRNTRMGAAIRHAASILYSIPSKVRILMIIGDGFPNDTDYKQNYAIEDTHKAILEARANSIFVKAITVNLSQHAKLDEIYGNIHHTIISDVQELPDRLLKIYGTLTKY